MELNVTFWKSCRLGMQSPGYRSGPINVQNISARDLYVNYQGDTLNVIS